MAKTFKFKEIDDPRPEKERDVVETNTVAIDSLYNITQLEGDIVRINAEIANLEAKKEEIEEKRRDAATALGITL